MPQRVIRNERGSSNVGQPKEAKMTNDHKTLTACQQECVECLATSIDLENITYLMHHPEIKAMLTNCIGQALRSKRHSILKEVALYFTNPAAQLDKDIRRILGIDSSDPYLAADIKSNINLENQDIQADIMKIIKKHYPDASYKMPSSQVSTPQTVSSSFISIPTSDLTEPTPEPTPIPEPTTSQIFYNVVVNLMDKATFTGVTDEAILYDTAYVELMKIVEVAMEIPVIEIRTDIADLWNMTYSIFEYYVEKKEKEAAALAWEKRMRKKLKRSLRRQKNFKGYETPPTPKSEISSHPSYKEPPPRPCKCHPQWSYNRYPKDRFGIYLPRDTAFENKNITTTPVISVDDLTEQGDDTTSKKA